MPQLKPRLIIVGAFPSLHRKVYGGVVFNCRVIMNSNIHDFFSVVPFDSTQLSNPPPSVLKRVLYSFIKVARFFAVCIRFRGGYCLIMAGLWASTMEKLFFCLIARVFRFSSAYYPLGPGLIEEVQSSRVKRILFRTLLRVPNFILCQGASWAEFFTNNFDGSERRLRTLPSWTATPSLLGLGASRIVMDFNIRSKDAFRVVFVGWLEHSKGVFELLSAFKFLHVEFDNSKLVFVGDGSLRSALESETRSLGLESAVEFVGWIDPESVTSYLLRSHVFALPSYSEGIPNSMIEAMCCRTPVLVTKVGEVPTYVEHLKHAYLIAPRSVVDLAAALSFCLKNYCLFQTMAENAYAMVESEFSSRKIGNNLQSIFLRE